MYNTYAILSKFSLLLSKIIARRPKGGIKNAQLRNYVHFES